MQISFPAILVAMAFIAMTPASLGQDQQFEPFQENGVIIDGINVEFAIEAAGEIWNAARLIDALAYPCKNVLPPVTDAFPTDFPTTTWSPVCKPIEAGAAASASSFNPVTVCENVFTATTTLINTISQQEGSNGRKRRQSEDKTLRDLLQNVYGIVNEIYGINAEDPMILSNPSVICATADRFLDPSLPDQISNFASELLSLNFFMSLGNEYLCTNWTSLIAQTDKFTEFNKLADEGAKAAGFTSRADLCNQLGDALAKSASERKDLVKSAVESIYRVFTEASQCKSTSTEIIAIVKTLDPEVNAALSEANILKYTGFSSTNEVCDVMGGAFDTYNKAFEVTMSSTLLTLMATAALILRA